MENKLFRSLFNCRKEDIGEVVIITCFDRLSHFEELFKGAEIQVFEGYTKGMTIEVEDKRISVINSGIGATQVGDVTLALRDTPCKAIIYTGTAGGIGRDISMGDIVVPRSAVIGEGFSKFYLKSNYYECFSDRISGDCEMAELFINYTESGRNKLKSKVHRGEIFTLCSLFAETKEFLDRVEKNNCISIDMETSAFFTAASVTNKKAMAVHYITDLPQSEMDLEIFKRKCMRIYAQMPKILCDFIIEHYEKLV